MSINYTPQTRTGVSAFRAVREAVPVEEIAGRYTELQPFGGNAWFTARCPLPDHEDKTPSFYIYPKHRWYCFGCSRGGDVMDLEFQCGDYGELWEAMIALAVEFDVELPERPRRWHDKERRHSRWREEADKVRAEVVRRRLFRILILPTINEIEDPGARRTELERAWADWSAVDHRLFALRNSEAA
jgi:hypothetical protein